MSGRTYWAIRVDRTLADPGRRPHFLWTYGDGSVAGPFFTDELRADAYVIQAGNWLERNDWTAVRVAEGEGELAAFIASTFPKATHVLVDPEFGDKEQPLQPVGSFFDEE